MSKVVIKKCCEYELDDVKEKIKESFDYLGGIEKLISPNARVFIKCNCVGPFDKDSGITTHPIIAKAVLQLVKERTKNIIIGDNPATRDIVFTLKKNGLYDIINEENVAIVNGKKDNKDI